MPRRRRCSTHTAQTAQLFVQLVRHVAIEVGEHAVEDVDDAGGDGKNDKSHHWRTVGLRTYSSTRA